MQEAFALKSTGAVTNGISNSPAFRLPDIWLAWSAVHATE